MAALTLTQAQDEHDRVVAQIAERQDRLTELKEYIDVLKQQEYLVTKKASLASKGTLDGVRF